MSRSTLVPALLLLPLQLGCGDAGFERGELRERLQQLNQWGAGGGPECPEGFVLDGADCVFSEEAVLQVMTRFETSGLTLINAEPFHQLVGPDIVRNVWVTPTPLSAPVRDIQDAADLFTLIDPEADNATLPASFPIGTLIVHEAVDRHEGHGVRVKVGGDGEDLLHGWWFGKVFDDGTFDENECSPCTACHADPGKDGVEGLWGVPTSAL